MQVEPFTLLKLHIWKSVLLLLFLLYGTALSVTAQSIRQWSLGYTQGSVIAHSKDVENTRGAVPFGVQADYSWRKTDSQSFKKFYGLPQQGISFSFFDFNNQVLGRGVNIAYFMEPTITFGPASGIRFRTAGGLSWLSNPTHPIHNPTNNSYSTAIAFYLGVGIAPYWQLHRNWALSAGATYRHISNGGIKLPNKGINWLTGEVMLHYFPGGNRYLKSTIQQYRKQHIKRQHRWDAWLFGAVKSISNESATVYPVLGMGGLRSWQTANTHAFTAGAALYYDGSVAPQLARDAGKKVSAWRGSVQVGHEFLWGKVIFAQQLGLYIWDQTPYYPPWYHRWSMLYRVHKHWIVGASLKAHKQVADFTDIRVVYSF
jgi:hypothetical protein